MVVADVNRDADALAPPAGPDQGGVLAVMREVHGLDISCCGAAFLARSLEKRRGSTACGSAAAYLERLADDRVEAEALFGSLRVGYSEFFRDPLAFALLERAILPELAEQRARDGGKEIRVWSAGCASGQEAWSVAILLSELCAAPGRAVPYRVFATDLCEPDLAAARAGVYGAEAVGNVRARHLRDYFVRHGESYAVAAALRGRVDFSVYDLLDECTNCPPASIYGDMDLVLCCNVLLYYRPEAQRVILEKGRRCLAPGGYLVTGETERQIVESGGGFRAVSPPAAVYRKTTRRS